MQEPARAAPETSVTVVPTDAAAAAAEQRRILEAIATGSPFRETLDLIVRLMETEAPGLLASILVLEGERLVHGAAPSLPTAYNDAIHGLVIGPGVGSCGTAAFTRRPVVVEDIATHPYWKDFRALAMEHGLRACWSTPILGRTGEVLGTFALYHGEPRVPRPQEERLVAQAAHLASIAIQHDRLVRAEVERMAESRKRVELREFFQRAPMPVALLVGHDLVYEFANPAYEKLVGRTGIEGRRLADVFPELEQQGLIQLLRSILDSGEAYHDPEMRAMLDRGTGSPEEGWFNVRIEPYRDGADGSSVGLLVFGVEVTEQVRARQELDARRSELAVREKTSALGQLVSGVAHEIRTPLTYLATNLNLIQLRLERLAKGMTPQQVEASRMLVDQYIPSALEAADRINHIVEDLRGFTQLRGGSREEGDIDEVVAQAVGLFQATHRGRVNIRLEPGARAAVAMDRLQVQQALLNLLQNAMEAQPRDHTIVVRTAADEKQVSIEVSDTGLGIPAEVRTRIFDPFFTTRKEGTGLGLSIVKRVVDDHHGSVSFETGPQGTTFRLALPLPRA